MKGENELKEEKQKLDWMKLRLKNCVQYLALSKWKLDKDIDGIIMGILFWGMTQKSFNDL